MDAGHRALQRRNALLEALHRTTVGLLDRIDPREVLQGIVDGAVALAGSSDGYIYLVDEARGDLVVRAVRGDSSPSYHGVHLGRGEGIAGRVWDTGKPLLIPDYKAWPGRSGQIAPDDVRAVLCVPLVIRGDIVGVLGVYHREAERAFDDEEQTFLEEFARLASVALEHARLIEAARASRALLEAAFESADVGRGVGDPQGHFLRVNAAFCRLTGRTEAELLGQHFGAITHPDDLPRVSETFESLARGEVASFETELRFVRKDGELTWAHANVSLVRDAEGKPQYVVGDAIDVTRRKRDEENLREQAVAKELVRQMLQGLARRGVGSDVLMRDIGRALAKGLGPQPVDGYLRAFQGMGLGELRLEHAGGGRYVFRGRDLLERERVAQRGTCHLPLGYLEAAVRELEGGEALGAETTCQSMGADACRFVIGRRGK